MKSQSRCKSVKQSLVFFAFLHLKFVDEQGFSKARVSKKELSSRFHVANRFGGQYDAVEGPLVVPSLPRLNEDNYERGRHNVF